MTKVKRNAIKKKRKLRQWRRGINIKWMLAHYISNRRCVKESTAYVIFIYYCRWWWWWNKLPYFIYRNSSLSLFLCCYHGDTLGRPRLAHDVRSAQHTTLIFVNNRWKICCMSSESAAPRELAVSPRQRHKSHSLHGLWPSIMYTKALKKPRVGQQQQSKMVGICCCALSLLSSGTLFFSSYKYLHVYYSRLFLEK